MQELIDEQNVRVTELRKLYDDLCIIRTSEGQLYRDAEMHKQITEDAITRQAKEFAEIKEAFRIRFTEESLIEAIDATV